MLMSYISQKDGSPPGSQETNVFSVPSCTSLEQSFFLNWVGKKEGVSSLGSNATDYIFSFLLIDLLFLPVLGLHCFVVWAFSSCSEWGLLSYCGVWASYCSGFSCCRAWALGHVSFSSCDAGAQLPLIASRIFLDQGSNHVPYIGKWLLNNWTTRESQDINF